MSEGGDVTLIQDEDLLRRMWQQTEDFSRKKEIRAHMYRLREERLRNLYSPEPPLDVGKGCEFTSTQGHVKSFADQSFQSMKSKEVRDAGSPPKDFTYRGQELKELSNAGWNVESEDRTADDGHVRVKSVQANVQGRYDVDGGKGQFAAIDVQKEAVTDYHDDNTSLKKNESTSHTAAREQVVRKTDDGTQFSSKTSSSTSSSKFQQVSSMKNETVPYVSNDDYDSSRRTSYDTNRTVEKFTDKETIKKDNEQNLRTEFEHGELESRKVEYPDSNTKVIVETRRLPDGSTVTSTRREMKGPAIQSSHSEHHSQIQKSKSEIKSSSASTHTISDIKESSAKTTRENITNIRNDIVDSQRNRDNYDFNRNMQTDLSWKQKEDFSQTNRHHFDQQHYETDMHTTNKEHYDREDIKTKLIDNKQRNEEIVDRKQYENKVNNSKQTLNESDRSEITKSHHVHKIEHEERNDAEFNDNEQRIHVINKDMRINENEEKRVNDEYQTTYQSEFSQKKVSMDWSPTHQAWASTLRADTPPTTRPSTRASSPGGRTFKSSTSSLRSSVSPDKTYKKPNSRSQSPSKVSRSSPTKSPDRNQPHTTFSNTAPEIKYPSQFRQRLSVSPDKKLSETPQRTFASPDRKPNYEPHITGDNTPRNISPTRPNDRNTSAEQDSSLERLMTSPSRSNISRSPDSRLNKSRAISPTKPSSKDNHKSELSPSPERKPKYQPASSPLRKSPEKTHTEFTKTRSSVSPDRKPGYMRPTASTKPSETVDKPNTSPIRHYDTTEKETTARHITPSPERKPPCESFISKITEHHDKFVDEEIRSQARSSKDAVTINTESRKSPTRIYPSSDERKPVETGQSIRPTLRTSSRSPSPTKGPVTFTKGDSEFSVTDNKIDYDVISNHTNQNLNKTNEITTDNSEKHTVTRGNSPSKFGTYTKKQYEKYDSLKHQTSSEIDTSVIEITETKNETHDRKSKSIINKDHKEDKKNTLPRQEKSSTFRRSSESPKKSFRESVSPQKSPSKDSKFKMTTEFIATEILSEENKRTTSPKNRPRQLVTPSTSPTRKPKPAETAPSTGQSSPTTSVSGFIYISSPRTEQVTENKKFLSEIDKTEQTASLTSDEARNSSKIPSHSKIPCRSPSPDKRIHSTNDGVPRKSSLKKTSKENNLDSPMEKPPTNFRVSPPVETVEMAEHKIIKKDRPDKSDGNTAKTKPPLERRETYEERCRKILGMMDDNTSDTKKDTLTNVLKSETSSTSVSPCPSPEMKEITPTEEITSTHHIKTKYDVTDFISREKESLRKTSPTKLEDIMSKSSNESNSKVFIEENLNKTSVGKTLPEGSIRKAPEKPSNIPTRLGQPKTSDEHRLSRSPSPSKKVKSPIDGNTELISSEREQEILDKVQKSLRKLSPNRKEKSPSREKSPSKTSMSLQDLEITKSEKVDIYEITSDKKNTSTEKSVIANDSKHLIQKNVRDMSTSGKSSARNTSPVKKALNTTSKTEKVPESPTKHRSISPRKPYSERPQSPQISKPYFKNKEPITTRRLSSGNISTSKTEKIVTTDTRKVSNVIKQNSLTNKTTAAKTVTSKGALITKDIKDTPITKKDSETKVTRTASDMSIKTKKTSPQRMRSKPEIQINDLSTTKTPKQNITTKPKKSTCKEPQKLTSKPKSATTLNTPTDEDDIIIDVEQAKSSRENSPDRICPTPVNLLDDVSTPRLPDEVSEPDDEFRNRIHHTIHEAESIVDDIVEISEEDELFSKMSNVDRVTETDECLLSVTDKVSRFSKIDVITKGKDTAEIFKDNEVRAHSDFKNKDLRSDECLLTVSEKVNKFAKASPETKDRSPQRRITDGYDTNTVYQDNYTKLSVNDKAHLFVETAENLKTQKTKSTHKIERPDLTNVDESLKSDDCLLSVSDKVNKFVRSAEQSLIEKQDIDNKEKKTTARYVKEIKNNSENIEESNITDRRDDLHQEDKLGSFAKETASSHAKAKNHVSPNLKQTEKTSTAKITTLRSSDAVKKAKAHFENIASTTHKTKYETANRKTTKLTDIGVIKKSPITDSTIVLHPSLEDGSPNNTDVDSEMDNTLGRPNQREKKIEGKVRSSPTRNSTPEVPRTKIPPTDCSNLMKPEISRQAGLQINESLKSTHHDINKQEDKIPGYQRPTKTSQLKEETKTVEETEISSRRGSGKFGVELRRTSIERSTVSSERRRSSVEHHQPCIEDIFDLDLLEQMLGKVVGYEQRRRIRAQMRIAKRKMEIESTVDTTHTKIVKQSTANRSPERRTNTKSPERIPKSKARFVSPVRSQSKESFKPVLNGHSKNSDLKVEPEKKRQYSPDKVVQKSTVQARSPSRHTSPDVKKTRAMSPNKIAIKPKTNRFSEYATAYMKKVGINEADKLKLSENKSTKTTNVEVKESSRTEESKRTEIESVSTSKTFTDRSSSKNTIEILNTNVKSRQPSPEKKHSPERTQNSSERLQRRTPSPDFKRPTTDDSTKEATSKTAYGFEKKIQPKQIQEEKPSWVTNRNLKKVTAETRTFSSKKLEVEKPKYRSKSPSKAINKPTDIITSSYGPGPLDSDGRPLFGIKALRNGTGNYQVKGTVIRQEYHSRNGGEPEGTVSVTAYSTKPEELQELLQTQGHRPPGRMHGLAAITTTKKFGGDTGTTLAQAHTKEEHASLEQFTHSDQRVATHREHRNTVRQSSVKSLTEKYIKSATETSKSERSAYPKAGLILRSANIKDNVSSESSVHAGLGRNDSEHSLASLEETVTSSMQRSQQESFLDSTAKVSGVQDILTRMKNADIVIDEGDSSEDREARALLNKFLGATVLMAGMQSYVTESSAPGFISHRHQETVRSGGNGGQANTTRTDTAHLDIDQCWDERVLKKLLQESTDYEQRRRLRARIGTLMAEQEACASAVTEALAAAGESPDASEGGDPREKEEVTTVTSSVRRNSSEKTVSTSTTTKTSKVRESTSRTAPKQVSPFAKFRQLEKQNSTNSPNSAASPQSPGSGQPLFKFTDPALQASANTIKERLLQWCRDKTRDYENVKLENFSTSWADGLAFCALIHHFLPDAFDYSELTPERRRHNFTLAFKLADEKAGIYPLLDVEDMVSMRKPDWKCVFTYVQAIHRRFKDE